MKKGILMSVRWCLLLMTMGVVIPTLIVVSQEVPFILDKSELEELKLKYSLSFYQKKNNFLIKNYSEQNLVSGVIASEEHTKLKQFPEPQSTRHKIEVPTSAEKVTRISCEAAFPEFTFPIKVETEEDTVVKKIVDISLNKVFTINRILFEADPELEEKITKNIEEVSDNSTSTKKMTRYQILAKADHLYRCGDTLLAERFYREIKDPFKAEKELNREIIPEPVYESKYLLPGAGVYWRIYQESLKENSIYKSKKLSALKLLTEKHPEFIPGHLHYARVLKTDEKSEEALNILHNATTLYPNEASLVAAKIEADEEAKNWLTASLTARKFFLFNQDHFRASEFKKRADKNLARYQHKLRELITWSIVGNAVLDSISVVLMGNVFAPISTLETTYLLIQGEKIIGENYAQGLKKKLTFVEEPEINQFINEIGQKLASVAGRNEFEYEFYIVMDENINAFALPGGKIFINAGVIAKTNSEAEIAGLIAHELAHTVLSHGFQQMTQSSLASSVVQYIPYLGGLAGDLIVLNYSRKMEEQADIFGTQLLVATGYAADGVRNLIEIMDVEQKNRPPAWLSSHPDTNDRVKYLEKIIVQNDFNRYAYEGVEKHYKIQQKVANLLAKFKKEKNRDNEDKQKNKEQNSDNTTSLYK
ncbi:MAG: M48 family metallopeptidase [cyanobacterium endosymbiont of Rhopalodia sterrenbergii]